MNHQNKKQYFWGAVFGIFFLAGCGGGSDGPQPLGLFDNQQQPNQSQPVGAVPENNGQVLSVSNAAMGNSFMGTSSGASGSASKALTLSPSFGFESFFTSIGKSNDMRLSSNCQAIDDMNIRCTADTAGPLKGSVNVLMTVHLTESTKTKVAGTVAFRFNFNNFTFKEEACGQEVSAGGIFGCTLDVVSELQDNHAIDLHFTGLCNTADDPDHLMDIVLGGKAHRVGYDLALDFQTTIGAQETRRVQLNESNITGTVNVDGVNHDYADLRNALGNSCGQ